MRSPSPDSVHYCKVIVYTPDDTVTFKILTPQGGWIEVCTFTQHLEVNIVDARNQYIGGRTFKVWNSFQCTVWRDDEQPT